MRYTNIVTAEVHQLEADENVSETCDTFGFKYGDHNSERLAYVIFHNMILNNQSYLCRNFWSRPVA